MARSARHSGRGAELALPQTSKGNLSTLSACGPAPGRLGELRLPRTKVRMTPQNLWGTGSAAALSAHCTPLADN